MTTEIYLGNPPQYVIDWIRKRFQPSELGIPLYFEGQEPDATVALIMWNDEEYVKETYSQQLCHIEYSTDNMQIWQMYDGRTINLDECANNRAYFRAPEGQPNTNGFTFNVEHEYYGHVNMIYSFEVNNAVAAGGNIQFLLESTGTRTTVPSKAFRRMFGYNNADTMLYTCQTLTKAPLLPATTLADYCYANMFEGCSSLTAAPVLPATTLADCCYDGMFYNCENLASIDVNFEAWNPSNATSYWLENAGSQAAGTKTFTCPATLPNTTGDSNIPSGWRRVNK